MIDSAKDILEEIAEEQRELKISALFTTLTFVGLVTAVLADMFWGAVYVSLLAYLVAYLAGGFRATKEALLQLFNRSLDINVLMVLAALAAAAVGEVRDGAILLFLFSLAGTLEGYAMGNTKRSIAALMDLRPDQARKVGTSGEAELVGVETLQVDDVIVVRPGERIPTDGCIVSGNGSIDQSSVTGESVPVDKTIDDKVFAGSLNINVLLHIKVTTVASESTLARMIALVTEAREKRSPSENFSEWFGERYTIVVLVGSVVALGVFMLLGIPFAEAAYKAATLLVVASPCAIVISVPAAVLSALAVAARNGVLFKGGAALEDFGSIDAIAFDKTGTLTHGNLEVVTLKEFTVSPEELLVYAKTVEDHSDHPLARSVVSYVTSQQQVSLETLSTETIAGKGIVTKTTQQDFIWAGNRELVSLQTAQLTTEQEAAIQSIESLGQTPIIVGKNDMVCGVIGLADTLRASAQPVIESFRSLGVAKCVMLTGDTELVAKQIGTKVGLSEGEIFGSLLPAEKVAHINQLRAEYKLAFVGDGINDAAALATANVGIAMGVAGSDVALEAADVALLSDDLGKLPQTFKLANKANRIIKQNLYFAVGIMVLMIIVTIFGNLPLPLGVIGHEGGTLLVVANSLRLLFVKFN